MNDLREVTSSPDFLERIGFDEREGSVSSYEHWIRYEKSIQSLESNLRFIVQVDFDLTISDEPHGSYSDNHHYSFNGVFLKVDDRQMDRDYYDNTTFDEETESPRTIDRWPLRIHTVSRLRSFCDMLGRGVR